MALHQVKKHGEYQSFWSSLSSKGDDVSGMVFS